MSDDLKPCPFCGEAKRLSVEPGSAQKTTFVMCMGCGASGPNSWGQEDNVPHAIAAWNRRAAPDLLATLEALRPQLLACHGASGGLTEAARNGAMAMVMAAIAKTKVPAS